MLVLYLAYRLLLAKDNQHSFNRVVLLLIYFVSFTASLFPFSFDKLFLAKAQPQVVKLSGIEITNAVVADNSQPLWGVLLIWIFIIGIAVVVIKTIITWIRLIRAIHYGYKEEKNGYTLVITDKDKYAPFSWMRYVVISRSDYEKNSSAIIAHELKHVACCHWIDLLIGQLVCALNWFNPVAWLMRDEIMLVHEYQADMAVIESGHEAKEYQILLIKKAVGARFPSLANSLNHSKLKKRITMMYKEKSGAGQKLKALALLPMLALALGIAGVPAVHAAVSVIQHSTLFDRKGTDNLSDDKTAVKIYSLGNDVKLDTLKSKDKDRRTSASTKVEMNSSLTPKNMDIYLDDKKIKASELKDISPERVASMTVDRQNNTIKITGKKADKEVVKELYATVEKIPENESIYKSSDDNNSSKAVKVLLIQEEPECMEYYIDGKKITVSELRNISPDKIASVTIDKKDNVKRLMISLKK